MRIKDTLNLGKTKFKMRGNLPVKEVDRQKAWADNKLYQARQKLNEGKPTFILHDGPPYANGPIHMGHAMNKISKDIIVRYKSMNGFRAPYVPGWDTHGLPIEQQLTKAGYDRKKMSTSAFRDLCREYALKQVDQQREGFKRLGVSGDWDNPYLTLKPEFEAAEVRVFGKMAERGLIYRGKKPVYWSWSSESAMAEAEVEYHDVTSPSAFFAEEVVDGKGILDDNTYFVVWTTTPWTIPASEGVTIDAGIEYAVVKPANDDRQFVLASTLVAENAERFGWEDVQVVKTVLGQDLENITAQHPFIADRKLVVMLGDFVTTETGTGLVHTAPGLGEDDFNVGALYHLPVLVPVNDQGYMTEEAGPDFDGVFYDDANQIALDKLKENNALLKYMPYEHSYPFDWRTKKPVIFRATPQWFASVDKVRDEILDSLKGVDFKPDWGQRRLANMIKDRGDWVISRQRVWGVPLPIFYAEDGTAIMEPATINHVADLFGQFGSNVWFDREAKDLLPEGYTNEHSPHGEFTKETDIMDVWFDSGTSHQGVLAERDDLVYPADVYLEGSDQYRGWFNSSLITSVAAEGQAPYKQVVSQGFTLDKDGHKMSKSLGNTIAPSEIIQKMGADIVRLWVTSVDTSADVRVSTEAFVKISDSYKKLRNTMRYLLANTSDFDPKTDTVAVADLQSVDRHMLYRLNEFTKSVKAHYDDYDFLSIHKELMNFVITELSAFYLDFAKDVLYIEAENSPVRRSMQTVFYQIAVTLTKLLTPILPHTTEEIWSFLKEPEDFVQLAEMPAVLTLPDTNEVAADGEASAWERFMTVRSDVLKALEEARNAKLIGKAAEAHLDLYVSDDVQAVFDQLAINVQQILLVSGLDIAAYAQKPADALDFGDVAIVVTPAEGQECQRCRLIKQDVGSDSAYPDFCARCAAIVRENFPETVTEGFDEQ